MNLAERLRQIYGQDTRPPTPAQIQAFINGDFEFLEGYYPPTEEDLWQKLPQVERPEAQKHHHRRTGK